MNKYRHYLLCYGIIPLLMVNEYLERNEMYEECRDLISAIQSINQYLGKDRLPMKRSKYLAIDIKWTIKKMGLNEENIMSKSESYRNEILNELGFLNNNY